MLEQETVRFIKHFVLAHPGRTLLLVTLLVMSGLAEGIGIVAFLPVLDLATGASAIQKPSPVATAVASALRTVGLTPTLGLLLTIIVVGLALKGAFRLLAMKQVGFTVARTATELRLKLLDALLRTRWAYFVSQPAGRFATAIGTEANRAANAYRSVCLLFAAMIQVVVYTVLAVLISWKVAAFALVAGWMIILVLGRMVRLSRAAGRAQTVLTKALIVRLTDALQGIKPIKAMGREMHLQPLLEAETRDLNRTQEEQVLASEVVNSAQEPILATLLAIGLYFLLTVGNQPFSSVLLMAFLFYRLAGKTGMLQSIYTGIVNGESAFWSLQESIDIAESQLEPTRGVLTPQALSREITLEGVSFRYREKPVLRDVSLTIPAGQVVALVGPSGAGKTTIADLIVGLHQPTEGSIHVDGVSLDEINLRAWRALIGYVPQEMFLFHDTLLHNVTLGDSAITEVEVREALTDAGAWEFVSQLPEGLQTVLGERGSRLSGGQRQRIAIARALVRRPKILILDEVTTALDPTTEAAICSTLIGLRGRVTVLSISHQPAMMRMADLVYRVEGGRVIRAEPSAAAHAALA